MMNLYEISGPKEITKLTNVVVERYILIYFDKIYHKTKEILTEHIPNHQEFTVDISRYVNTGQHKHLKTRILY